MGTLYLVATPIGNLEDITLRALRLLKEVALVAAEDTRHTQKLFERHIIHTRLISYHEHNKLSRVEEIMAALAGGDVALVSDAGTPGLNDPGYELVCAALQAGYPVSPIPGPSAPVAALVASGLPADAFLFLGYLPRRSSERRRFLERVRKLTYTLIFLETPHRMGEALTDLLSILGDRPAAAARELTKLHEEILRMPLSALQAHFKQVEPRGEFTLVVQGAAEDSEAWDEERVDQSLREGISRGDLPSELAERVALLAGWRKNQVYRRIIAIDRQT
jgi:16S rRNA (cytidine1402-2'-O)-methyltransferase